MAVLPAAKAYPRGGAPRRSYVKGAPLYARFLVKFNGKEYPRGSELPVASMTPAKHYELWVCGKADHLPKGPFDSKAKSTPVVTPPVLVEKFDASDETLPLEVTAADGTEERVEVEAATASDEPSAEAAGPSTPRKRGRRS